MKPRLQVPWSVPGQSYFGTVLRPTGICSGMVAGHVMSCNRLLGKVGLDRFNVYRFHTRRVFSGTWVRIHDMPAMIRYLDHIATAAPDQNGIPTASAVWRFGQVAEIHDKTCIVKCH
ncbi:hypothetical protein TNCV_4858891 [Trichonephila clavipes]|nr:hypothetical protein TNCV_4858891 [Trichonephila clavipes]